MSTLYPIGLRGQINKHPSQTNKGLYQGWRLALTPFIMIYPLSCRCYLLRAQWALMTLKRVCVVERRSYIYKELLPLADVGYHNSGKSSSH